MISADFLELLRCPETGQALGLAGPEVLTRLNERISQDPRGPNGVVTVEGVPVEQSLVEALVRHDRLLLYPVRDGIPVLLAEEAIRL